MAEQFSRRQVELILRRTAELERKREDSMEAISTDDLEKVAAELGMSQEALRQALAESRAGMLTAEEATFLDRFFGSGLVEARRFVPTDLARTRAAVERFLQEQGFQIKRHRGDITVWEPARDLWSWLRRTFRGGPYRLPRELDIEVRVAEMPGGPHPVLVQLKVDAHRLRGTSVGGSVAAVVLGTGIAIAGSVLLPLPTELALWAAGAGAGTIGVVGARSSYRKERERLEIALERFLDFLEHEPPQLAPAQDPFSRLAEFLNRDWWR